jgi:hypothetical protein
MVLDIRFDLCFAVHGDAMNGCIFGGFTPVAWDSSIVFFSESKTRVTTLPDFESYLRAFLLLAILSNICGWRLTSEAVFSLMALV